MARNRTLSSLVLIPWPETCWSAAGRVVGGTPLPLTPAGADQAKAWGKALANKGLDRLICSEEQASVETAKIVSGETKAKRKKIAELAEVDAGLWDGLTVDELRRRYPKIFKRWYDDPTAVRPPEGEDVVEASQRLHDAVDRVTNHMGTGHTGIVLGPLAFGVVRCIVESVDIQKVRTMMHGTPLRYECIEEPDQESNELNEPCAVGTNPQPTQEPQEDG